ncbi:MAG TPA: DUF2197 domain-containing protein [Peptococcaceae bacterium]|nr:DUF2197 domain-containing protein [Peptococcaceae bacterium]
MEVKCALCGRVDVITKIHKDYFKIARQKGSYICEMCEKRVRYQAVECNKPKKPM